jgi:hypothetical protein
MKRRGGCMEARLHAIYSLEDLCTINTCYQFSFNPLFSITVLSFPSHTSTKLPCLRIKSCT